MTVNRKPLTETQIREIVESLPIRQMIDAKIANSPVLVQKATESILDKAYSLVEGVVDGEWEAEFGVDQVMRKLNNG